MSARLVAARPYRFNKGDLVWTFWNTGAMGLAVLYGRVTAAGPQMLSIVWESGFTNRVRQTRADVKPVEPSRLADATRCMAALGL